MASLVEHTDKLGKKNAAHLLRRLTWGATKAEIDLFAVMTPKQACDLLLTSPSPRKPPIDPERSSSWLELPADDEQLNRNELKKGVVAWWLDEMINSPLSATPKVTFFLHTHFTTIQSRLKYAHSLFYQLWLLRSHSSGSFKSLARDICIDSGMLEHLDGKLNEKNRPNENFAREFLELYTIGKGEQIGPGDYTNYTEEDVVAAARVFSGYKIDTSFSMERIEDQCVFARLKTNTSEEATQHDAGEKIFSSAFGHQLISPKETINGLATEESALDEIDQLVEMIFDQHATALHFSRKIYRYFVYYQITEEVEEKVIAPLAQLLIDYEYQILPVLKALMSSTHFFALDNLEVEDNVIGAIIKSPLDIIVGSLRFFKIKLPDSTEDPSYLDAYEKGIYKFLELQGLPLYEPFEVAGYPAYHQYPAFHRNWITANYLARRYEYSKKLLEGLENDSGVIFYQLDIVAYVDDSTNISDPLNPRRLVEELVNYLLPEIITEERFQYFLKVILLDSLSEKNWQVEWQKYKSSGDDQAVRIQLENLVKTIMQSPEFQLS